MENDATLVEKFIDECIEFNETETVTTKNIYNQFVKYCESINEDPVSRIAFTKEMKQTGDETGAFTFIPRRNTKHDAMYQGINLK